MIYVLIIALQTMQGEAVTTQEFNSKSRCLDAREIVMKHTYDARAFCVLK
ncbi:Phage protein [Escherichia phage Stevie_ev116]|uniref:Phage protein n=1 Tax=Escherichia phage Stevie_ev116 TaxID=2695840 RepID=A0A653G0J4_9CAUD|nr:Phage protein [Escherichia phage Stevie_ev116]